MVLPERMRGYGTCAFSYWLWFVNCPHKDHYLTNTMWCCGIYPYPPRSTTVIYPLSNTMGTVLSNAYSLFFLFHSFFFILLLFFFNFLILFFGRAARHAGLSSPTRDQTCAPGVEAQYPNHWTTREVPNNAYPLVNILVPCISPLLFTPHHLHGFRKLQSAS